MYRFPPILANITALTGNPVPSPVLLAGFLHDFAFVLWRQQVKGTFAWKNRSCCPPKKQRGLETWRSTGLLLSYNLQIALLVPSCTFIESYTCFQLQVVGVSTWNYAYPFIAVRVQASCTTTHELRLAVPMRKVYFVSIFKKQLRKPQIAMFKFQPLVLRGDLIQKPGFSCFLHLWPEVDKLVVSTHLKNISLNGNLSQI